ncbi:MAG: hypothetical protein GVY34_09650 [Alphaproteobacteria bacterium]|jgi:hypothetical protein|nr:hypothetical protein [Alphaproteobacteria bacterium]
MDTGIMFLLGVYLVPLAFVSGMSAWADGRRPYLALILGVAGGALVLVASLLNPDGAYGLEDIPLLTLEFAARIWRAF